MSMQLTIEVPNNLGQQLLQFRERIPEFLERGMQTALDDEHHIERGEEAEILALLAAQPTPQQVLALRPSPKLQPRARLAQQIITNVQRSVLMRICYNAQEVKSWQR